MDDQNNLEKQNATKVGYGNPPTHSRFRRGQSGNPKGRPKGTLNMATVLERTLREKVVINKDGKPKRVTKLQAALNQLSDKAAAGELRAVQLLTALVRTAEERVLQEAVPDSIFDEPDEKVVQEILRRFEAATKGGHANENKGL
jgi:Family of unknown function (DUF5681)